ncbi:MAG: TraB/GumN family protein [Burkholderiaceae bacterium]
MSFAMIRGWRHWLAAGLLACLGVGAVRSEAAETVNGDACPPAPQVLTPEQVRAGMRDAVDHGFLWRVTKDGRSSWLYGTIHVARPSWMYPGPTVMQALAASDVVALELDLADPDITRRLAEAVAAPKDQAPLPPPLAARMARQADAACFGQGLAGLRPEMQAMTLVALAGRRDGLDPAYAVDGFLAGLAHGLRKPVRSLETPEEQIALLLQPGGDATERLVNETLDELESGRGLRTLRRLAEAWSASRFDELGSYPRWCECLDTEDQRAFSRRLIEARNLTLADKVKALHAGGQRAFVAVGALHMVGPQGPPALLAEAGFLVEPFGPGAICPPR